MFIKYHISIVLIIILTGLQLQAQNKQALIIGISDYPKQSGFCAISGVNDYEIISKTFKNQGFKIDALLNSDATGTNIRKALDKLATSAQSGDYIYIHFSTHGQPFEDLPPYDEEDLWDESIVSYDAQMYYKAGVYVGENHILDDELSNYFDKIRLKIGVNGFLCVALDACHSGTSSRDDTDDELIIRGTGFGFSPNGKLYSHKGQKSWIGNITKLQSNNQLSDILILEACKADQLNYEITENGINYGSLSFYIAKILKNQPFDKSLKWALEVKQQMFNDNRLINQQMEIETSLLNN